ncbi:MAG TPA: hypothetical protein VE177_03095, partial [Candidatus Binatus sp.]|nr:hypothetical protein [Candidatus Binatus sp.]
MQFRKERFCITLLVTVLLLSVQFQAVLGQYTSSGGTGSPGLRQPKLTIKIVFLGINASQVDSSYLLNDLNVPADKFQSVLQGGVNTGVLFNFNY